MLRQIQHRVVQKFQSYYLLDKLWGEYLPFSIVAGRAKFAWHVISGEVEGVDMGNGWIRFNLDY